jgi:pimeloyl-ACP methyl ester carboxylesterase
MRPLEVRTRQLTSFDGTPVTYQVVGEGGPWVLLANGLGGNYTAWRHQLEYLRASCRLLTWDYRGLREPASEPFPPGAGIIQTHARDLAALLDAEKVDSCVWMGWSAGVQVMLEAMRLAGERATHLVVLNVSLGRGALPLNPMTAARKTVAWTLDLVVRGHPLVERVAARAARWPETVSWMKRLGVVASTVDQEVAADVAASLASVSMPAFFDMLRELEAYDVAGAVERIRVPSLWIIGERDAMASRREVEELARRVPGAESFVIRGATHFAAIEYPELVNLRVEKFLREHGG